MDFYCSCAYIETNNNMRNTIPKTMVETLKIVRSSPLDLINHNTDITKKNPTTIKYSIALICITAFEKGRALFKPFSYTRHKLKKFNLPSEVKLFGLLNADEYNKRYIQF